MEGPDKKYLGHRRRQLEGLGMDPMDCGNYVSYSLNSFKGVI